MNAQTHQALRDQRTYYVSDERLREFGKLSHAQRLAWVEQCSTFVRMAQAALRTTRPNCATSMPPERTS
jgi:hypothetical protein